MSGELFGSLSNWRQNTYDMERKRLKKGKECGIILM